MPDLKLKMLYLIKASNLEEVESLLLRIKFAKANLALS
jgi:hypothetical protein